MLHVEIHYDGEKTVDAIIGTSVFKKNFRTKKEALNGYLKIVKKLSVKGKKCEDLDCKKHN